MTAMQVQILDYGLGNANSIASCLRDIGCYAQVTKDPAVLSQAEVIFIPGVGSFAQGMKNLQASGLDRVLHDIHQRNRTYLVGICLGMQLFATTSEEGAQNGQACVGLGWIPGSVKSLKHVCKNNRLPHIGWNNLLVEDREEPLTRGLNGEPFYFDHEYFFETDDKYVQGVFEYGVPVPCIVRHGKVIGFQFHPEKSQISGKKLLIQTLIETGVERRAVWIESV